MSQPIPEGFYEDAHQRLIPKSLINEIDLVRDNLVKEIAAKAFAISGQLSGFKTTAMDDITAFLQLSAEKYGVKWGGRKGNLSLLSYDGRIKVQVAVADALVFDERLQIAKTLLDQCFQEWCEKADVPELKIIVDDAFSVDKEGKLNTKKILGLRRHDIKHEKWITAMKAIGDSLQVVGSKSYIRIYTRMDNGDYKQVCLDLAGA